MTVENSSASQRESASFRDPSGYVFTRNGGVYRAIDEECYAILQEMDESGLLRELMDQKYLVKTRFVDEPELLDQLQSEHTGYARFLEHEKIAPITFPYEWSLSALADAAVHTLKLQKRLLEAGLSLKDATAYNIQFVGSRPVFIDISSIERPPRLDIWTAMSQFGQMFMFPLLLFRYQGWDLRSYFLGSIGGRDAGQVARGLGRLGRWRPRNLLDVTLPAMLHNSADKRLGKDTVVVEKKNTDATAQQFNLNRMQRKIERLAASYKPASNWASYTSTCSYDDESESAKKKLVGEYFAETEPKDVLDMGCNTGEFSLLAAGCGARVISADADHDAVELLNRRLKNEPAPITPVVLDLCNPSPAIGYMNQERASFLDRLDVDCVLALALIHHLHVSGNLPLPSIRDLFARMTRRDLVLEFVPTDDVMFRQLTSLRRDLYQEFTLDACKAVFGASFELLREDPIPGSPRTLLLYRKRS